MNSYKFNELQIGTEQSFLADITAEKMDLFYKMTGDSSPIHISDEYAQGRGFSGRVVYGMLGGSLFSTLAGVHLPGEHCLLHSVECKFAKPVFIGDTLTVKGVVTEVNDTFKTIKIKATITNQNGKTVTRGIISAGVAE